MKTKYGEVTSGSTYYHGTSSKYLSSILENGILTPRTLGQVSPRSDRTCEVDMDAVYITRLHFLAHEEATKICQDTGGDPVVIAVQYTNTDMVEDPEYPFDTLYLEDMEEQPMCFKVGNIHPWYILGHEVLSPAYLG